MPELPEVETVVRFIKPLLVGKVISGVVPANNYQRVFSGLEETQFNHRVQDAYIRDVLRRGKYLLLQLDRGYIGIHLRMTGRLLVKLSPEDKERHLTAVFYFTDGSKLYFKDYRKFGRIYFYPSLDELNQKLGPEPLGDDFTMTWLQQGLAASHRQIKPLLLDQKFIAGLGNIYVDEALWQARIHPEQTADSIPAGKSTRLHQVIRTILATAIENSGTTFINFRFGEDSSGRFASKLQVFGRTDEPCPRCGNAIIKIKVGQRGTHLCPACQKP